MGPGPVPATKKLLDHSGLRVDAIELNEAVRRA
jgi:acetyl-CoA acetyltransferase